MEKSDYKTPRNLYSNKYYKGQVLCYKLLREDQIDKLEKSFAEINALYTHMVDIVHIAKENKATAKDLAQEIVKSKIIDSIYRTKNSQVIKILQNIIEHSPSFEDKEIYVGLCQFIDKKVEKKELNHNKAIKESIEKRANVKTKFERAYKIRKAVEEIIKALNEYENCHSLIIEDVLEVKQAEILMTSKAKKVAQDIAKINKAEIEKANKPKIAPEIIGKESELKIGSSDIKKENIVNVLPIIAADITDKPQPKSEKTRPVLTMSNKPTIEEDNHFEKKEPGARDNNGRPLLIRQNKTSEEEVEHFVKKEPGARDNNGRPLLDSGKNISEEDIEHFVKKQPGARDNNGRPVIKMPQLVK